MGTIIVARQRTGDVAELADALDLGSSSFTGVQVQLLSSPPSFLGFLQLQFSLTLEVSPKVSPNSQESKLVVRFHPTATDLANTVGTWFNPRAEKVADESLPEDGLQVVLHFDDGHTLVLDSRGPGTP